MISIPFLYLIWIWNSLPEEVPMHWNLNGQIDRYGKKSELILIPILMPLLTYGILLLAPLLDNNDSIKKMGEKFSRIKFVLVFFMSLLSIFIIYTAQHAGISKINFVFIGLGGMITMFGNYFKTIRPNYIIGIRTPWTLKNEIVWNKTHQWAGRLWFLGGLVIIGVAILSSTRLSIFIFFSVILIISILPIVYSYIQFKNQHS